MPKLNHSLATATAILALVTLAAPALAQGQKGGDSPQNVEVVNTPERPVPVRDMDNPARQPIQRFFVRTSSAAPEPYRVPDGKRLVIEHISGQVTSGATCTAIYGRVSTTVVSDGTLVLASHRFPLSATPLPSLAVFSHQVRLYADPNSNVTGNVIGRNGAETCTLDGFSIVISGYLVDVPQPAQQ